MDRLLVSILIIFLGIGFFFSCQQKEKKALTEAYYDDLASFKAELKESRETNWMALSGFYLLKKGDQWLGSDSSAEVHFPSELPEKIMRIQTLGDSLIYSPNLDVEVRVNGEIFTDPISVTIKDSIPGTLFSWGTYEWWVRAMGDKLGVRLRSTERQVLDSGVVGYFPTDPEWIKTSDFTPSPFKNYIQIQNSIGVMIDMEVVGNVNFSHRGTDYSLDVFEDYEGDDKYFLIIGDETNGISTYAAGRYGYFSKPQNGKMVLDFNYLYSPPCAFTAYATCPFPPPKNRLKLEITAGEMINN